MQTQGLLDLLATLALTTGLVFMWVDKEEANLNLRAWSSNLLWRQCTSFLRSVTATKCAQVRTA